MADVYVAAGSNVEPEKNLARALDEIERVFGELAISPAYRNPAVGFAGADFINLVVGFRTADAVSRVKQELERIETLCGRPRDAPKWAPRTMDLDILMYDQLVSDTPGLIVAAAGSAAPGVHAEAARGPCARAAPSHATPHDWRAVGGVSRRRITRSSSVTIPRSGRRPPPGSAP